MLLGWGGGGVNKDGSRGLRFIVYAFYILTLMNKICTLKFHYTIFKSFLKIKYIYGLTEYANKANIVTL